MDWIEELREARKDRLIGGEILYFPKLDSTNIRARGHGRKGAREGLVILADSQTAGKGRMERRWDSPPGVNVYFSVLLRPPVPPASAAQFSLFAGIASAKGIRRASGLDARIKWPNDILIHGKKTAGILSEMEPEGSGVQFVILGIGVNVNWRREDFPADLQGTATSLRAEAGAEIPRARIAAEIFQELEDEYARFLQEGFSPRMREEWNRLSWMPEGRVSAALPDRNVEGWPLGLDTDGALLLKDKEGNIHRFIAGEISLLVNSTTRG